MPKPSTKSSTCSHVATRKSSTLENLESFPHIYIYICIEDLMSIMTNIHLRYVHTPSHHETSFLISGSTVLKPVTHLLIMPKRSKQAVKPAAELPPVKRRHTSKSPPDHGAEAVKKGDRPDKTKPFCLNKKFQKPKKTKKDKKDKENPTKPNKTVVEEKSEVKEARSTRPSALKRPSATALTNEKDKAKLAALKERIDELGALDKNNESGDDGDDSSVDMEEELMNILQPGKGDSKKQDETEEKTGESESEGSDDSEQEDGESCESDEAESSSEDGTSSEDDGEGAAVDAKGTSIVPHEDPDAAPEVEQEKPLVRNSTWSLMLSSLLSFPPSLRIRTLKIATK